VFTTGSVPSRVPRVFVPPFRNGPGTRTVFRASFSIAAPWGAGPARSGYGNPGSGRGPGRGSMADPIGEILGGTGRAGESQGGAGAGARGRAGHRLLEHPATAGGVLVGPARLDHREDAVADRRRGRRRARRVQPAQPGRLFAGHVRAVTAAAALGVPPEGRRQHPARQEPDEVRRGGLPAAVRGRLRDPPGRVLVRRRAHRRRGLRLPAHPDARPRTCCPPTCSRTRPTAGAGPWPRTSRPSPARSRSRASTSPAAR
jgi:hypothetical protein